MVVQAKYWEEDLSSLLYWKAAGKGDAAWNKTNNKNVWWARVVVNNNCYDYTYTSHNYKHN